MHTQSPNLPASGIRIRVITGSLVQPDVNVPNISAWELMNRRGVDITSQQTKGNLSKVRVFKGKNGVFAILTKGSSRHLCERHGYQLGIDDLIPPSLNSKPTKYPSQGLRTRTQGEKGALNQLDFGNTVQTIMQSPDTQVYPEVEIRGVKGHGYFTRTNFGPDNPRYAGFFISVHTEGKMSDRLLKAQPINYNQLKKLKQFNKLTD